MLHSDAVISEQIVTRLFLTAAAAVGRGMAGTAINARSGEEAVRRVVIALPFAAAAIQLDLAVTERNENKMGENKNLEVKKGGLNLRKQRW